jgi:uncharacterized coiled-coil DUF342 family protein
MNENELSDPDDEYIKTKVEIAKEAEQAAASKVKVEEKISKFRKEHDAFQKKFKPKYTRRMELKEKVSKVRKDMEDLKNLRNSVIYTYIRIFTCINLPCALIY